MFAIETGAPTGGVGALSRASFAACSLSKMAIEYPIPADSSRIQYPATQPGAGLTRPTPPTALPQRSTRCPSTSSPTRSARPIRPGVASIMAPLAS